MTPRAFEFTQAEIRSIASTVDKGLRFSIVTGEISPEHKGIFFGLQGTNVMLKIIPEENAEEPPIEITSETERKSQSERLKNVLFVWHKQLGLTESFSVFYERQTNLIIEKIKSKLEPES